MSRIFQDDDDFIRQSSRQSLRPSFALRGYGGQAKVLVTRNAPVVEKRFRSSNNQSNALRPDCTLTPDTASFVPGTLNSLLDTRLATPDTFTIMRVTGGIYGGRKLCAPPRGVRPTQDRVRESLFNSLAGLMDGARVLDLYAGAGTLGIEALSRGAACAVLVERSREAARIIERNLAALEIPASAAQVCVEDVLSYMRRFRGRQPFDVIFADPPYGVKGDCSRLEKILKIAADRSMVVPEGLIAYEQSAQEPEAECAEWRLVKDKSFGTNRLLIYQRAERKA